jgi:hypothetical protein
MTLDTSKAVYETSESKNQTNKQLKAYAHFTEHLMCVTENPPQEYNKN